MGKHFALKDSETDREIKKNCGFSILKSSDFTIFTGMIKFSI